MDSNDITDEKALQKSIHYIEDPSLLTDLFNVLIQQLNVH